MTLCLSNKGSIGQCEIDLVGLPFVAGFHGQGAHQPQAGRFIRKDARPRVRRRIFWFSRSSAFTVRRRVWCAAGRLQTVNLSGMAVSSYIASFAAVVAYFAPYAPASCRHRRDWAR